MALKIEEINCEDCGQEYEVKHFSKEPITHCVFCGSETMQIEELDDDLQGWYDDDDVEEDEF
jgi:predicted nucleic acid-binding Zn ribbon protein